MKYFTLLIACCVLSPQLGNAQLCGTGEASGFDWPLIGWQTNTNGFWDTVVRAYHLGVDSSPGQGAIGQEVHAVCSGVVREAEYHNGYGGTVIIECFTGSECVSVLEAHMFTDDTWVDEQFYQGLRVSPNEPIQKGQIIGQIANSTHNGGWAPHVHLGIRKGSYQSFTVPCSGGWSFAGYGPSCVYDDWYDPDEFIPLHGQHSEYSFNGERTPLTCLNKPNGGEHSSWIYSCDEAVGDFLEGDTVYTLLQLDEVFVDHRYKVVAHKNGQRQWDWTTGWNTVDERWGWRHSYFWPSLYNASPGGWEFRYYLDTGHNFPAEHEPLTTLNFVVHEDQSSYHFNDDAIPCYGPVSGGWHTNWWYTCENQDATFNAGDTVYSLLRLHRVKRDHRYRVEAYRDGIYQWEWSPDWNRLNGGTWETSHFWSALHNATPGVWQMRLFVDIGEGYEHLDNTNFRVNP